MSEAEVIARTPWPLTLDSLRRDFSVLGLRAGDTVLVHSAMSQIGWIAGGAEVVIRALLSVLTPSGTLMMPAHTGSNSDPAHWQNPPVPESWWPVIRAELPAFNPVITPTRGMGVIAEMFRNWPGTVRSAHPSVSFAAVGPQAEALLADHSLEADLGEGSPLSRLYDLDGYVMLLGAGHDNNTSLHLAEYRARWPGKTHIETSAALLVDGERQWVNYKMLNIDTDDFEALGRDFEAATPITIGKIGEAETRFFKQRPLVDFAATWFSTHRR